MAGNSVQAHQIKRSDLQFVKKIGEGGYSTVYEMLWKTNGNKHVAVKKLNKIDDREVEVLLKLEHTNIVQLLGVVDEEMDYMLVLEYCHGGDLRSYLDEHIDQPLSQQLFCDWLEQAAKPVQYLQKMHIIHKDIKSGNYLITQDNTLKLADFGLAKKSKQGYTVSNASGSATYAYMAPELAIENKLSPSYDIFALAVVIWELLTRQVPFKGKEHVNIMYIVCNNNERPPIPSDCLETLANLMRQCWDRERTNRPSIDHVMATIKEAKSMAFFVNDDECLPTSDLICPILCEEDMVQEVPAAVAPATPPSKADEAVQRNQWEALPTGLFDNVQNILDSELMAIGSTRSLSQENLQYLAGKIFTRSQYLQTDDPRDDARQLLSAKECLPGRAFTFLDWFQGVLKFIQKHLLQSWNDGAIVGFIDRERSKKLLVPKPNGTFLLRFSESQIGAITVCWISPDAATNERIVWNLEPFSAADLSIRSLADRIQDLTHLTYLYPDTPRDKAFGHLYSQAKRKGYNAVGKDGYVSQASATVLIRNPGRKTSEPALNGGHDEDAMESDDLPPQTLHLTKENVSKNGYTPLLPF